MLSFYESLACKIVVFLRTEKKSSNIWCSILHQNLLISDPSSLMYAIQQQALGSIQWTIIASGLKETIYTITTLSKSVRYAFRVLSITPKAFSKPSSATDPVQLLDRGTFRLLEYISTHQCVLQAH